MEPVDDVTIVDDDVILDPNCCAERLDLGGGMFRTGWKMRRIFLFSGSS